MEKKRSFTEIIGKEQNKQFVHPQPQKRIQRERIDVLQLKSKLNLHLGELERGKYWKSMRQYFCNQITRSEFDRTAKQLLSRPIHHRLHNELVKAILSNAQPYVRPPPPTSPVFAGGYYLRGGAGVSGAQSPPHFYNFHAGGLSSPSGLLLGGDLFYFVDDQRKSSNRLQRRPFTSPALSVMANRSMIRQHLQRTGISSQEFHQIVSACSNHYATTRSSSVLLGDDITQSTTTSTAEDLSLILQSMQNGHLLPLSTEQDPFNDCSTSFYFPSLFQIRQRVVSIAMSFNLTVSPLSEASLYSYACSVSSAVPQSSINSILLSSATSNTSMQFTTNCDSATFIALAVELFVKNLLSSMVLRCRSRGRSNDSFSGTSKSRFSLEDLLFTIRMDDSLLIPGNRQQVMEALGCMLR